MQIAVDSNRAAARQPGSRRGAVLGKLVEGAVVARPDDGVVDGGIESAFGPRAPREREPDDLQQVGACLEGALAR